MPGCRSITLDSEASAGWGGCPGSRRRCDAQSVGAARHMRWVRHGACLLGARVMYGGATGGWSTVGRAGSYHWFPQPPGVRCPHLPLVLLIVVLTSLASRCCSLDAARSWAYRHERQALCNRCDVTEATCDYAYACAAALACWKHETCMRGSSEAVLVLVPASVRAQKQAGRVGTTGTGDSRRGRGVGGRGRCAVRIGHSAGP